jgi:hypothetical protein
VVLIALLLALGLALVAALATRSTEEDGSAKISA